MTPEQPIFYAKDHRVYHTRLGEIYDLRGMRRVLLGISPALRSEKVAAMRDFRRARQEAKA
jgi:hypothetical protein